MLLRYIKNGPIQTSLALILALLSLGGPVAAESGSASEVKAPLIENNPNIAPDVLVSKATDALLHRINTATAADKKLGISFYESLVDEIIGPFVDFETIAYRVMGRSVYDSATDDQRVAFVVAFKRSLITTYAKGISTYDNQLVLVSPFKGAKTQNGVSRAKVELQIQPKGGKPFSIIYSMFQGESRGWLLENMHLDGVNVGSTFRNQFNQSLKDNNNNIDKLIASWGADS